MCCPGPCLISLTIAGPLFNIGTAGCGIASDIQAQPTVLASDSEKAIATVNELPVLPGEPIAGKEIDVRASLGVGLLHIDAFITVPSDDPDKASATDAGAITNCHDVGLDRVFSRI